MVNTIEKFLFDSDTLIAAARLYYAHDLVPTFWDTLATKAKSGNIILLDLVKNEIDQGNDWLKNWMNIAKTYFPLCNHTDSEIVQKYAAIMQYIQSCGFYNTNGLNSWAKSSVADPWLIATAAAKGYTLITFEQSSGSLSTKNKSGKVKIPDVAKNFNVEVHNLYYMMRQLEIII